MEDGFSEASHGQVKNTRNLPILARHLSDEDYDFKEAFNKEDGERGDAQM